MGNKKFLVMFLICIALLNIFSITAFASEDDELYLIPNTFAVGNDFSAAIDKNGDIYTWGANEYGVLGSIVFEGEEPTPEDVTGFTMDFPSQVGLHHKIVSVAASKYRVFAIDDQGEFYFWGMDTRPEWGFHIYNNAKFVDPHKEQADEYEIVEYHELPAIHKNYQEIIFSYKPILLDKHSLPADDKLVSVIAEETHIFLITESGALYGWGNDNNGQILNNGSQDPYQIFDSGVVDVATSPTVTVVLKSDGSVWVLGTLIPDDEPLETPKKVMDNAVSIAAGDYTAFAVGKNGNLYAMGSNETYALGLSGNNEYFSSMETILTNISDIEVYRNSGIAIKDSGATTVWGDNINGKLGARERFSYHERNLLSYSDGVEEDILLAAIGEQHSLMVTTDGRFIILGNSRGVGNLNERRDFVKIIDGGVKKAIAGDSQSVALMKDGSVWVWGYTSYLPPDAPSGFQATYNRPYKIFEDIDDIYGYENTFYAKTEDGELISWGNGHDNAGNKKIYPKTIISNDMEEFTDLDIVDISVDSSITYMVMRDTNTDEYSYYAWGYNLYRYGDGTQVSVYYPQKIELEGLEFVEVTGGTLHSLALTKDGQLYAWGINNYGQVGLEPILEGQYYKPITKPTHILTDETFKSIQAFDYESIALSTDGQLYVFGRNGSGGLGLGDTEKSRPEGIYPPEVLTEGENGSPVDQFDQLFNNCLALSGDSLWGWGWNIYYKIQPSGLYQRVKPVVLMDGVISAAMSMRSHLLVLKDDGSLWGKGSNSSGQLGVCYGELEFEVKIPVPSPIDPGPGEDERGAISITLTDDDMAAFSGMTLRLVDKDSSTIKTMEISALKYKYDFKNLQDGSQYILELLTPQNIIFDTIDNIIFNSNENTIISLSELEKPLTAEVSVVAAGGLTLPANLYSIFWYDENDTFISVTNKLKFIKPGAALKYQVNLNNSAIKDYQKPEIKPVIVTEAKHKYQETLTPYSSVEVIGKIQDTGGNPIEGAYISIMQYQGEPQAITATTRSAADGMFTLQGISGTGTFAVGKSGYISIYQENVPMANNLGTFTLSELPDTKLLLNISARTAGVNDAEQISYKLNSFDELEIAIQRQGVTLENIIIQSPYIYFPDGILNKGDTISVSVKHAANKYGPKTENLTVTGDYNAVSISIIENGYFNAKLNSANAVNNIFVFAADGSLIKKYQTSLDDNIKSDNLVTGNYKLVFIGDTTTALIPSAIADMNNAGFTEGKDYVLKEIAIAAGKVTEVEASIPTIPPGKQFARNGAMAFIPVASSTGNRMLIRTEFDLLQTDWDDISNSSIKFSLPKGVSLVTTGIMLNNKEVTNYSFSNSTLSIPVEEYSNKIKCYFYVDTVETGLLPINAYFSFMYSNTSRTQQIASGFIELSAATTLNVPNRVNRKTISANGSGRSNADIRLYDNGVLVGETKTNAKGEWVLEFDLFEPYNFTAHKIYAEVKGIDGSWIKTESVPVYYYKNEIELKSVTMEASKSIINYNFYRMPQVTPTYIYNPSYPGCVFKIYFDGDPDLIYDVYAHTKTVSGQGESLKAKYDKKLGCWIASTRLSSQNLVTGFEIEFSTNTEVDYLYDVEAFDSSIKKHAEYVDYLLGLDDELFDIVAADITQTFDNVNESIGNITTDLSEEYGDTLIKIDGYGYFKEETKTTEGLTEKELLADGFTLVKITDGTSYYMKNDVLNTYYVNLADNKYIISSFIPENVQPMNLRALIAVPPVIIGGGTILLPPRGQDPNVFGLPIVEEIQEELEELWDELDKELAGGKDPRKIRELQEKIRNKQKLLEMFRESVESGERQKNRTSLRQQLEDHLKRLQQYNQKECKNLDAIKKGIDLIKRALKLLDDLEGIETNVEYQKMLQLELTIRAVTPRPGSGVDPFKDQQFKAYQEMVNQIMQKHVYLEMKSQVINKLIDETIKAVLKIKCVPMDSTDTDNWGSGGSNKGNANPLVDPSGIVYEAVPDNAIEGVTATVVYKDTLDKEMVWNAEEYGQINPQLTGVDGFYAWDVLPGEWKVYYEKEGYISSSSDWLPVPPPQLEVNIGLVSLKAPQVSYINTYEDYIEIIFDKYMTPDTLNTDTIILEINGQKPEINIEPTLVSADEDTQYARVMKVYLEDYAKISGHIKLTILSSVTSYAGITMGDDYSEQLTISAKPQNFVIDGLDGSSSLTLSIYEPVVLDIDVRPKGTAKGNIILAQVNDAIIQIDTSSKIDQNSNAQFTMTGFMEGKTSLTLSMADGTITKTINITVQGIEETIKKAASPIASVSAGVVEKGTIVRLSTSTIGGYILYTTNGECPIQYGETYHDAIIINETTRIRAYATAGGHDISGPLDITYTVKQEEPEPPEGNAFGGGSSLASYTITFNSMGGSDVKTINVEDSKSAVKPANPTKEGFTFSGWYTDKECTKAYDWNSGVTQNITLYAKWVEASEDTGKTWANPFSDVKTSDWFYGDVEYMHQNGLMAGTTTAMFSPNEPMTRGMAVTVLWRLAGEPEPESKVTAFSDLSQDWYRKAILWSYSKGIVMGYDDTMFCPDDFITREQIAAILYRYITVMDTDFTTTERYFTFADSDKISEYANNAIQVIANAGIMQGKPGNLFDPQGNATRAEVAAMLHRYLTIK